MAGKHANRRQARGIRVALVTVVVVAAVAAVSLALGSGGPGSAHGPHPSQGAITTTTLQKSTATTTTATTTTTTTLPPAAAGPHTSEHYAANGNFSGSTYLPGAVGFNLADVSSNVVAAALPAGVKALVWIGTCNGATASFQSSIASFVGDANVFGFYLMDDPDPSSCSAANLKAESDWIHAHDPGTYTFMIEQDLSGSDHPSYKGGYNPANSDIDLYGLDLYPCRTDNPSTAPCTYSWIRLAVTAAENEGIPLADIVPIYQTFGGGSWADDSGGAYQLPTAEQESKILSTWGSLVPTPVFDYAYSWGSQRGDVALGTTPSLQSVFQVHNG
jgi:hypothetical protein